jgi:hypothetical protein
VEPLWAAFGAVTLLVGGRRFVEECRATVRGWSAYKRQTGTLLWLSIVAHFANWFAVISGMIFIIVKADKSHWSRWLLLGVLILAAISYGVFWNRLKREVKLSELRTQRRLRREHLGF